MVDLLALFALRAIFWLLAPLPLPWQCKVVRAVIQCIVFVVPRYRRIAERNLERAFPASDREWREEIFRSSLVELSRGFVDFARLDRITPEWVAEHVECPFLPRFQELKQREPDRGILIATGHLGSFELLAHVVPILTNPIAFVVRNFTLPRVDRWWTRRRERGGNKVIARRGAFKEITQHLCAGWDVALLMDQNVKRNHAVFVDFFGIPAATSKTLAIAALRARARVVTAGIVYLGDDRYRIEAVECDLQPIYDDESLSADEKVQIITQQVATEYERIIRMQPAAWFWMHRRWKTRPDGEPEDFYR